MATETPPKTNIETENNAQINSEGNNISPEQVEAARASLENQFQADQNNTPKRKNLFSRMKDKVMGSNESVTPEEVKAPTESEAALNEGLEALRNDPSVPPLPDGRREQVMKKIGEVVNQRRMNWEDLSPRDKAAVCALALVAVGAVSATLLFSATALGITSFSSIGMFSHVFGVGIAGTKTLVGGSVVYAGGIGGMGKAIVAGAGLFTVAGGGLTMKAISDRFGYIRTTTDVMGSDDSPIGPSPESGPSPETDSQELIHSVVPFKRKPKMEEGGELAKFVSENKQAPKKPTPDKVGPSPKMILENETSVGPDKNLKGEKNSRSEMVNNLLDSILSKNNTDPFLVHDFQLKDGVNERMKPMLEAAKNPAEVERLNGYREELLGLLGEEIKQRRAFKSGDSNNNPSSSQSEESQGLVEVKEENENIDISNPDVVLDLILKEKSADIATIPDLELKTWCNVQSYKEMKANPTVNSRLIAEKYRNLSDVLIALAEQRRLAGSEKESNSNSNLETNTPNAAESLQAGEIKETIDLSNPNSVLDLILKQNGIDLVNLDNKDIEKWCKAQANNDKNENATNYFPEIDLKFNKLSNVLIALAEQRKLNVDESKISIESKESEPKVSFINPDAMSFVNELPDGKNIHFSIKKATLETSEESSYAEFSLEIVSTPLRINNLGEVSFLSSFAQGSELVQYGSSLFDISGGGLLNPDVNYIFEQQPIFGDNGKLTKRGIIKETLIVHEDTIDAEFVDEPTPTPEAESKESQINKLKEAIQEIDLEILDNVVDSEKWLELIKYRTLLVEQTTFLEGSSEPVEKVDLRVTPAKEASFAELLGVDNIPEKNYHNLKSRLADLRISAPKPILDPNNLIPKEGPVIQKAIPMQKSFLGEIARIDGDPDFPYEEKDSSNQRKAAQKPKNGFGNPGVLVDQVNGNSRQKDGNTKQKRNIGDRYSGKK